MSSETANSIKEAFKRIAGGDSEAYTTIFMEYYDKVYSKALFICKVPATASDIAQQVFLKLWEQRHFLSKIENPEGWLLIMARNQVLDVMKHKKYSDKYFQYLQEIFAEEDASPEQILISRQRKELINKSLQALTAKQREIYLLHRENGLTYQEIADNFYISKDTVKEHIAKAISRIRSFLIEHRDELTLIIVLLLQIKYF